MTSNLFHSQKIPVVGQFNDGWTVVAIDTERAANRLPFIWVKNPEYGNLLFKVTTSQFNSGVQRIGASIKRLRADTLHILNPYLKTLKLHNATVPQALLGMPKEYRNHKTTIYIRSGIYMYPQPVPVAFMEALAGGGAEFRMPLFPDLDYKVTPLLKKDLERPAALEAQVQLGQARIFQMHHDAIAHLMAARDRIDAEIADHRAQMEVMNTGVPANAVLPTLPGPSILTKPQQETPTLADLFAPPSTDPNFFIVPTPATEPIEPAPQEPASTPTPEPIEAPAEPAEPLPAPVKAAPSAHDWSEESFDNERDGIVPLEDRDLDYYSRRVAFYAERRAKGEDFPPGMAEEEERCKTRLAQAKARKALYSEDTKA